MRNLKLIVLSAGGIAALCFLALGPVGRASESPNTAGTALRIGTFQRTELLVAYYKSTIHDKALKKLQQDRDQAQQAGNKDKVKELEAQGGALQEFAHKQLAGEATLNNVLVHLQAALPAIAKQAGVSVIVEQPLYRDPSVQEVDITVELVKQFEPANKKP